jgi:ABC-type antimicrobial peptide transport system ATPase subunit
MIALPPGCAFHPRCPYADLAGACVSAVPPPIAVAAGHTSACHFASSLDERRERV